MSQSLLIQGRFQQAKSFQLRILSQEELVAIPFDPGQVSTLIDTETGLVEKIFCKVAIPFDPGQVSTREISGRVISPCRFP